MTLLLLSVAFLPLNSWRCSFSCQGASSQNLKNGMFNNENNNSAGSNGNYDDDDDDDDDDVDVHCRGSRATAVQLYNGRKVFPHVLRSWRTRAARKTTIQCAAIID